jgi:uncharacterized damage-inducible protein DinB
MYHSLSERIFMTDPQTKAELIERLSQIQRSLTDTVQAMSSEQFNNGTDTSWSASRYLQHLILSVKPFAKAMKLPTEQLKIMFGQPERLSRNYAEVVAIYKSRLDDGVKAEDYQGVNPNFYRFPEGVEDQQQYLVETWNESNNRLFDALAQWSEEDLDHYQIPHPIGEIMTMREMLFFTVYHNTLHWNDIQYAGAQPVGK